MAKVLKRIKISNPLYHFKLYKEIEEYEKIKTDVELVDFFHKMFARFEECASVLNVLTMMMSFAVGTDIKQELNKLIQ